MTKKSRKRLKQYEVEITATIEIGTVITVIAEDEQAADVAAQKIADKACVRWEVVPYKGDLPAELEEAEWNEETNEVVTGNVTALDEEGS